MKLRAASPSTLALFVAVATTMAVPRSGADEATEHAVAQLETERVDAVLKGDRAVLDRIFADDLTYVHASGRVDTKATMLADVSAGKMKYKKFDRSNVKVRTYSGAAVVTGMAGVDVDIDQKNLVLTILFTGTYVKQPDGRWQMVAWQSTKVSD